MAQCPVCHNEVSEHEEVCPACGYCFQEATQEFQLIPVESEERTSVKEISIPTLSIRYGEQEGLVYKLDTDVIHIGRSPKCEVLLNNMTVSRIHAKIEKLGNEWIISDCDSFNGVWINNKAVDQAVLHDGDTLQIGSFILRFDA